MLRAPSPSGGKSMVSPTSGGSVVSIRMKFAVLGLICVSSLLVGLGLAFIAFYPTVLPFISDKLDRRSPIEVSSEFVNYQSQDGVRIGDSWFLPRAGAK